MGETAAKRPGPAAVVRRFVSNLGPGIVTGAADDDPSGIATYSIAGARFGTSLLWTAWLTWPLMAAVQMTCARVGMVTGRGLAGALRQRYPRWLLVCAASALFVANTINVGADLSGMADAAETLTRIDSHVWVVLFGAGISWAIVRFRYHQIASILKGSLPISVPAHCSSVSLVPPSPMPVMPMSVSTVHTMLLWLNRGLRFGGR